MDLSNWRAIHKRYTYPDPTAIKKRIAAKGYVATGEDIDIINQIALWKYDREVKISGETIEYLNSVAKSVASPEVVLTDGDVSDLINELLTTKGIGLPLASTILKFYQPKAFPIIDQRGYYQLFEKRLPQNAGLEAYREYLRECIAVGRKYRIPFDKVDEVLYQKDKDEGRKLNDGSS